MSPSSLASRRGVASIALILSVIGLGALLVTWKRSADARAAAAAPAYEPVELVTLATASPREHRGATTAIGTVLALRSVTLRTELAGTVRHVALEPGAIVEPGTVLVALDVSLERAELAAARAEAELAATMLGRFERLQQARATSEEDVDRARAQRDVAFARIAQIEATIAKKTIRAPFRARVGIADVHPGQYLNEGAELTTLQGIADAVHVDFTVSQAVAAGLREGSTVHVVTADGAAPLPARVVAVDARVDPTTRNATVRARLAGARTPRLLFNHLLPNIAAPLVVVATLEFGLMILFEAGLSFLGLGIQPPMPSWGSIMSVGRNYVGTAWWIATFPGICLFTLVLSVNICGDHLRDRFDPRSLVR
ncbi:MAG TPA: efflux RND transporter periplasmic adaptor subunit [Gemmatimonadales bacterium]|nr:efflux RND transporter periplasmic adaptor subunit [Gemmatimonadales bacterium]